MDLKCALSACLLNDHGRFTLFKKSIHSKDIEISSTKLNKNVYVNKFFIFFKC